MSDNAAPWQLSALELVSAFRDGSLTPIETLQSVLARFEAVNPAINAVVSLDMAGAEQAAKASGERWRAGTPLSAIDGVPLSVKDNIHVAGLPTTWGSQLFAGLVPAVDETPVARLRAAGAVIFGKTNVPEMTLHGYTSNAIFGVTRNPWDLSMTPGGSSGGAVAAVAAGIGPVALATDGGGSIRRPAAHTGLVGFKPSRGAVPRRNGLPVILDTFEVAGPIARTIDDVASMMNVIGGHAWHASAVNPHVRRNSRILFVPTFDNAPVDPIISAAVRKIAESLSSAGHDVEEAAHCDIAVPIDDVWPVISQCGIAWLLDTHPLGPVAAEALVGEAIRSMAEQGRRYSARAYAGALNTARSVAERFDDLFDSYDLLLTPATAAMPWPADEVFPAHIDGKSVGPRGHAVFTPFVNAVGLPAMSLPVPVEAGRMPIGFQLVSKRGSDHALLDAGRRILDIIGQTRRWPDLRG